MALRKKHVRRIVFVLLFLLVLGPLAFLLLYGAWLGSGGMNAELERELASRLRCKAHVRGAQPTGLKTAVASHVELLWRAGPGHLTVVLEDLEAEANEFGWYVRAARGSVTLAGPDPAATLAAINQRLVQAETASPLVSLVVERLDADLDLGLARLSGEVAAVALSDTRIFRVTIFPPLSAEAVRSSTDSLLAPKWTVAVLLDPASDRGVFGGMKADAKDVPAAEIRQLLGEPEEEASRTAGTFDVSVRWHWPEGEADKATVAVRGRDLELADWTRNVPGGPITGKVQVAADYTKTGAGPGQFQCTVKSDGGGLVSAETLRWLEETLPTAHGYGELLTDSIGYERLALNFRTTAEGLGCLGEGDDSPPLLVTDLFGEEVPILWATAEPFQGRPVLEKLLPALLPSR
ncbi:MAG: hypothetical protein WBD75_06370 [Phycisphaerae bacterium]